MGEPLDAVKKPEIQKMMRDTRHCLNCNRSLPREHGFKIKQGYCSAACYYEKPPKMAWLEWQYGMPIRDIVVQTLNRSSTMNIVAELLGISKYTLYQWIEKLHIRQGTRWNKGA
jgi:ribosomal protein L37E